MNKLASVLALLTFLVAGGFGLYGQSDYTDWKSRLNQHERECGPPALALTCDLEANSLQSYMNTAKGNRNAGFAVAILGPVGIWLLALLWRAKSTKLRNRAKLGGRMAVAAGRIAVDELSTRSARATRDVFGAVAQMSDSAQGRTRECPFCAEMIKPQAKVCRHCGNDVA
jgi:hypothetical protein